MNNSINIKGIIFQIDSEALSTFRAYQKSVRLHFSTYEDSEEIIEDIESRFAELFHDKLNAEKRKSINPTDVKSVMNSMGSIADFEEMDDTEEELAEDSKLFRDGKRKIIFGVASGLANYLKIDPAWIRFIFASLSFIGLGVVLYLLLTLIMPVSEDLEEPNYKRLFRNTDDKVVSGVSAGFAKCFGIDPVWFRLIFVALAALGGLGFLAYLILMIIIPEAKTASEKTEMNGNPITLENIEKNLKANLGQSENQENALLRFLLLPLKLLVQLISNSETQKGKKVLNIARIIIGLGVLGASAAVLFGGIMSTLLFTGFFNQFAHYIPEFPVILIASSIPDFMAFSHLALAAFSALLILFLSICLLTNKSYIKPWAFGIVFLCILLSGATLAVNGIILATDFKEEFTSSTETLLDVENNTKLQINTIDNGYFWNQKIDLKIKRTEATTIKIETNTSARAYNSERSKEYLEGVNHYFKLKGSVLELNSRLLLNDGIPFRNQKLELVVYVPSSIKLIE